MSIFRLTGVAVSFLAFLIGGYEFVYLGLGENERAIEWLEKAFEERAGRLVYLRAERAFDPLRGDPRFQRMVERLNFPK